jgi:hypothetical protein
MKIATITPMRYTPGELEYFQFIRGGVGADHHQGPTFHQFTDGTCAWSGGHTISTSAPPTAWCCIRTPMTVA